MKIKLCFLHNRYSRMVFLYSFQSIVRKDLKITHTPYSLVHIMSPLVLMCTGQRWRLIQWQKRRLISGLSRVRFLHLQFSNMVISVKKCFSALPRHMEVSHLNSRYWIEKWLILENNFWYGDRNCQQNHVAYHHKEVNSRILVADEE